MTSAPPTEPMTPERAIWLRAVAREQRALLLCILAYLLLGVAAYVVTGRSRCPSRA